MFKKNLILLFIFVILFIFPLVIHAAATPATPNIDVTAIMCRVIDLIWIIFIGVTVVMFAIAGILYLTARGEPSKVSQANKAVIWGVVGVSVGILAWSAYSFVYWFIYGGAGGGPIC